VSATLETNTRPADPTNAAAAAVRDRRARQLRWVALGLLVSAQFVVMLDTSIVNVALPSIQSALGLSPTAITWVVNAHVLAFGGLLLLSGHAADLFGRRRMFVAGSAPAGHKRCPRFASRSAWIRASRWPGALAKRQRHGSLAVPR
jgi:hypothetical protein